MLKKNLKVEKNMFSLSEDTLHMTLYINSKTGLFILWMFSSTKLGQ